MMIRRLFLLVVAVLLPGIMFCQNEAPSASPKPVVSAPMRLSAAKTVFVRPPKGNRIPYEAIRSSFEGWGRYALVDDEAKADLIVEIKAPQESGGFAVSSSNRTSPDTGRPEESTTTTKTFSNTPVSMVVLDAKTNTRLWMGSQTTKSAVRRKAQEDNQVEAAQMLFRKFHDHIEPPPTE